jgi:hypothetical protein
MTSTTPLVLVLGCYAATEAVLLHADVDDAGLWFLSVTTVLFAVAAVLVRRAHLDQRRQSRLIVLAGALFQSIAVTRTPLTSDDAYRYAWDAKVQLHGIDPYRYAPSSPQLAHLRDGFLFGPSSSCGWTIPHGCTAINRPDVHTIYPPVAQAAFDLGRLLSFGGHGGLLVYQLLAAAGCVVITLLLISLARRRGVPVFPVALWAWCPVVVIEFGNNAHIDWLAVLLTVAALEAGARRRDGIAGVLAGAAIATKLYPALAVPALMRGRPWLVAFSMLGTVAVSYLPHLFAVGGGVLGYLPGYLREDGYDSGRRLILLGTVFPHPVDSVAAAVVLAVTAAWVWRRADPHAPEHAATVITGVAFLVAAPSNGWYAALLIALAVVSARYEWLAVALAPSFVYLTGAALVSYLVGAIAAFGLWRLRLRRQDEVPVAQPSSLAGELGTGSRRRS